MFKGLNDEIYDIIDKGIKFLSSQQQKNGSFLSLSSNSNNFDHAKKLHSIFSTSLILSCLNILKETANLKQIKHKAANFLLKQKSEYWSFNYWPRNSQESKLMPYPDDLDDTFCALVALFNYNKQLIDGSCLANIVTLLTALEKEEGGPYRTWLVKENSDKIWQDVDLAVNSNIAYFLSLQDISLPKLNKFIESRIDNKISSPYYPAIYPLIYFISRFYERKLVSSAYKRKLTSSAYKGEKVKKLKKMLLSQKNKDGFWSNPLNSALAVTALLNFGASATEVSKGADYLFQKSTKSLWQPYGFCFDPSINGQAYLSGSASLTCAFILEALAKYLQAFDKVKSPQQSLSSPQKMEQKIYAQVIDKLSKRFLSLDNSLKIEAQKALQKTLKIDKDKQIVLMPYFFKTSIGQNGKNIKEQFLIKLGVANLYGWIAYTIYDDFLDQEGDPKSLSVANLCLRELTTIFNDLLPKSGFRSIFTNLMDQLDSANAWEVTFCRTKNKRIPNFGDYQQLAHKSSGHALGPLAIIFYLGFRETSAEVLNFLKFFKHYLIARQLNDDAHDWEKDLKIGQINSVGALLLKKAASKKGLTIKKLQEKFWYETIEEVCALIFDHVDKARKYLKKCSLIVDYSLFDKLLSGYQQSARQALDEREEAVKFLKTYQGATRILT